MATFMEYLIQIIINHHLHYHLHCIYIYIYILFIYHYQRLPSINNYIINIILSISVWKLPSMEMELENGKTVCVTGAGGFLGSWVVKLLLSKGYMVHGTLRNPFDDKYSQLKKLENASHSLKLFKADLLDYDSIYAAIEGCNGVFHVASPIPYTTPQNPEVELLEPAIKGTLNVLKACVEAKVKKVVVVSSIAAVLLNPSWPKGQAKDENCWSDKEYCRTTKNWYFLSKTEAESEAFDYAKRNRLDVVTVCPSLIFGPLLLPIASTSSSILLRYLQGGYETTENKPWILVDVRDVAEADGRYICTSHHITTEDLIKKLKTIYPKYNYPKAFSAGGEKEEITSEKLQKLGWSFRTLDETLIASVESYQSIGVLD